MLKIHLFIETSLRTACGEAIRFAMFFYGLLSRYTPRSDEGTIETNGTGSSFFCCFCLLFSSFVLIQKKQKIKNSRHYTIAPIYNCDLWERRLRRAVKDSAIQ
ncbi:MAG: hypothetical protein LBK94_02070 [Prevotellaceae bacterium]|jgi:hypothetical protein|nr:hypothetical protein [Prevotellaceae bacterium]